MSFSWAELSFFGLFLSLTENQKTKILSYSVRVITRFKWTCPNHGLRIQLLLQGEKTAANIRILDDVSELRSQLGRQVLLGRSAHLLSKESTSNFCFVVFCFKFFCFIMTIPVYDRLQN